MIGRCVSAGVRGSKEGDNGFCSSPAFAMLSRQYFVERSVVIVELRGKFAYDIV